jgi:hypothetical protein
LGGQTWGQGIGEGGLYGVRRREKNNRKMKGRIR